MKLAEAVKRAKRVYVIGNGGSYANAVHIVNDLLSAGIKAYTLDPASLTASANDFGYETVFSRWLKVVGEEGDLLIALSGSGKSRNIIEALEAAKNVGMKSWAITGAYHDGFPCSTLSDHCTQYGKDMQDAEQRQIQLGHHVLSILR